MGGLFLLSALVFLFAAVVAPVAAAALPLLYELYLLGRFDYGAIGNPLGFFYSSGLGVGPVSFLYPSSIASSSWRDFPS